MPTSAPPSSVSQPRAAALPWPARWSRQSLRTRLLALGLMPLVLAFPVLIVILVLVGGERAERLMHANLHSNLAGSRNYLEQLRHEAGSRVRQLAYSERLTSLVNPRTRHRGLDQALMAAARSSGLDFLIVASVEGRVIGSSSGVSPGTVLPDAYVLRQARLGVAQAAFERQPPELLAAYAPGFPASAHVPDPDATLPDGPAAHNDGLLINAAAHFPLAISHPDALLIGGILLNRNQPLIDHMREIIYPLGTLPSEAEGSTAIYIDGVGVAISQQHSGSQRPLGSRVTDDVVAATLGQGHIWLGQLDFGRDAHMAGFEPLTDGDGRRIAMIGVSFPVAPYQQAALLLLGMVAGLLALTMLAISILFLRTGRELTQQLDRIGQTMREVGAGNRQARVGRPLLEDELGSLVRHFDRLLDTIAAQDARQLAAQQQIADEASRRRTLFEKVHDGIVILNPDGSVFEANPRAAVLLGQNPQALLAQHVHDWEARLSHAETDALAAHVGAQGTILETVLHRSDGSMLDVEVSLSRAEWDGRTFLFALLRDISERKASEAELAEYRQSLEALVMRRTQELNEHAEQLDAIFALSPDGFVSFDRQLHINRVNDAFLRMTGLPKSAILGLDEVAFSALLSGRSLPVAPFPGVMALRTQSELQTEAGATATAQRQLFELAPPASRVLEVGIRLAEASASVSQILYFRDVTHETEVDRMKSEFLTTAAHELRTPMASIYGYTELLRLREFEPAKRQQLLETISRQSQLMSSIINELLDLARIESRRGKDFVIERLAVQALVAEAVAGYKPPPGREAPRVTLPQAPVHVNADRQKIQQALLNILSNAYKYSPAGGEVQLRLQTQETPAGPRVGIEVQDGGIGMTPEQLARIFERFYRADASGNIPGTGLGMSIVKEIVELHRGTVQLGSSPGQGTTVVLWLPLAD